MLSVIIETRDNEIELTQTLSVLVAGAVEGLVSDVIVLDHASRNAAGLVADAAGARYCTDWDMAEIIRTARGNWFLLLEAGARPTGRWIDEIADHVAHAGSPARFSPSRHHRRPLLQRLLRRRPPLELGFLLPRGQAAATARSEMPLADFVGGRGIGRLSSELVPAWAATRRGAGA
ncbi:hypothetical protein [Rhizobium sp. Root482]|uniref:hypothetical protein n=1 Tax=Rhizobium sp. Root482 TaxID=1736543 RepID=UPI0006FC45F2|nr:hypothetical protein [Rhizobium sp. Root482]KQY19942.1 glycosyl transferase [Rhizobium sp. Root482]